MAAFGAVSEPAIFLVVPLFGVLAVWCTYRLGVSLGQPLAGGLAAVFLSVSPTFLYQLVQPMGDIPAAACWLAALIARHDRRSCPPAGAGLLTSVAIADQAESCPAGRLDRAADPHAPRRGVRWRSGCGLRCRTRSRRDCARLDSARSLRFARSVPGTAGSKTGLRWRTSCPMSRVIRRWLTETHTPFIWLSVACAVVGYRGAPQRACARGRPSVLALAVWAAYLPYVYFQPQEWFYTRFLLPAIAIMLLFAVDREPRRCCGVSPAALRLPAAVLLVGTLVAAFAMTARSRQVFELRDHERKYPVAGALCAEQLPADAFVLAAQHSGSIQVLREPSDARWDLLGAGAPGRGARGASSGGLRAVRRARCR